ncbi:MAG: DUF3368 domain-containing protein [Candidatus Methanoperedens sp.]|nr:DUF3368 domain-containing protein [Candidatus Methanoperedens sp.]CAG0980742.1 hypothetical protein METP3_02065 [Methanosarcinales archaeon]
MKPLVFDATPLIYLGKIKLLDKVAHFPEDKYITKSIFREVVERGKEHGTIYLLLRMMKMKLITRKKTLESLNEMIHHGWRCSTELYAEILMAMK